MKTFKLSRSKYRYRWVQSLESSIVEMFIQARNEGLTHDEILSLRTIQLFEHPHWYMISRDERTHLMGVFDGCMQTTWRRDIQWGLGTAEGPVTRKPHEWTEQLSELCHIPGALFGGHFWTESGKVFTDYKCTNPTDVTKKENE